MKRSQCTIDEWRDYERKRKAAWRKAHPQQDRMIRMTERANAKRARAALRPPVAPVYVDDDEI